MGGNTGLFKGTTLLSLVLFTLDCLLSLKCCLIEALSSSCLSVHITETWFKIASKVIVIVLQSPLPLNKFVVS